VTVEAYKAVTVVLLAAVVSSFELGLWLGRLDNWLKRRKAV
jgi:hypothetical protein